MSGWHIRYLIAKNRELRGTIEDLKFEIKNLKKYCANLEEFAEEERLKNEKL